MGLVVKLRWTFIALLLFFNLLSSAAIAAPQKLTVILDWYVNPDHAPLVIAQQKGFFKEQGLNVTFIVPSDPADPPKWVAYGKADIAVSYEPEFMMQVDQGLPLISIGSLINRPLNCLAALKSSGIQSVSDLKGKRIATGSSGLGGLILSKMLSYQAVSNQDVEFIHIRYNLTQALLSRKVDAVNGMMRNIEIPALEAAGHQIISFYPENLGIPKYSELIFIVNTKNRTDPRFRPFLKALENATAWLSAHPEAGWALFIKRYPEANNPVNKDAWFATIDYFAKKPAEFDRSEWEKFAQFMHENRLIRKAKPVTEYILKF